MIRSGNSKRSKSRGGKRRSRSAKGRRNDRFLSVESLENRCLLSASPLGIGGSYLPLQTYLTSQGGFLTDPAAGDPLDIAIGYLQDNAVELGLSPVDFNHFMVTDQFVSEHTGTTHIYLRQTYNSLEVINADINVNVTADGRILNLGSTFVSGLNAPSTAIALNPYLDAVDAVETFASALGFTIDAAPTVISEPAGFSQSTLLSAIDISLEDIPAELHYVPTPDGGVELAWNMNVQTVDGLHWYDVSVGADDGAILYTSDWVAGAEYNVVALPLESPDDGDRSFEIDPQDPIASPFGWHNINAGPGNDFTDTRGNNVFAQADRFALDLGVGPRPDGGTDLIFDFPFEIGEDPAAYTDAAVTNLFYWNNVLHDIHYEYGFDEVSGNFQFNNFGKGGFGTDQVIANAQSGADVGIANNANFGTPPDGQQPTMNMFVFDIGGPRDSDFDSGIITHEYGHGVSNRLTGGPANAGALSRDESGGMGEGWSDWWALMLTQQPGDSAEDARFSGTHVLVEPEDTGPGIRNWPYSFDMTVNPLTYARFNSTIGWPDAPNSNGVPGFEVHNAGEIWASALWDLNWLLINGDGDRIPAMEFDSDLYHGSGGNNLAMQLVMDGLKIQPPNPTMLDGRNAILAADLVLTGGQNQLVIWTAFAHRGMGYSAQHNLPDIFLDVPGVAEAFDLPPDLVLSSGVTIVQGTVFEDTNANGAQEVGESGFPGATVFLDANGNGTLDLRERSTETDGGGVYSFQFADPGAKVTLIVPSEFSLTFPTNSPTHSLTGLTNTSVTDLDFGIHGVGGTITGTKWNDLNADAIQDEGEPGLDGVFIFVDLNEDGRPNIGEPATRTASDGSYEILQVPQGEHIVREVVPFGFLQTFPVPEESGVHLVMVENGATVSSIDFGNQVASGESAAQDDEFLFGDAVMEDTFNNPLDVLFNDIVTPGSTLQIISVGPTSQGGVVNITDDGQGLLYTPFKDFFSNGFDVPHETFTYTIEDQFGGSSTAEVTVEVVNVNDPPVANNDEFEFDSDSEENVLNVLVNDEFFPDPLETLTIVDVSPPDMNGTVTIDGGTRLLYTPAPNFVGRETFTYTISDGNGGTAEAMVEIEVVVAQIQVVFRLETTDTDLDRTPISSINIGDQFLLRGFVEDVRGGDKATGVFAAYLDVVYDSIFVSIDGDLTFGPSFGNGRSGDTSAAGLLDEVGAFDGFMPLGPGEFLLFEVPFRADKDEIGTFNFMGESADVLPLHAVILSDRDETPVPNESIFFGMTSLEVVEFRAVDDEFTVLEGSENNELDLLANDLAGTAGSVTIIDVGDTDHGGVVEIAGDGKSVFYTSAEGFLGIETFTYTIKNANSGSESTATVTVAVPGARDDEFVSTNAVNEDTFNNPLDVLANDVVTPGGTLEIISPIGTIITSNGGQVTNDGGTRLLYTPADDFFGTETFTYTVDDEFGDPSEATVTVEVINVNDAPTANNDGFNVDVNSASNVLDVLANDTFLPDPFETLTIINVGEPDNEGTVTFDGGNQLLYTPMEGFVGTETFTYTISDGQPSSFATATVRIDVGLDNLVRIRMHTTDIFGQPTTAVEVGDRFQLHVEVDDLRDLPEEEGGVFSAYLDVLFNPQFVSVVESITNELGFEITFGDEYGDVQNGSIGTPGLIDEVGALAGFTPTGQGEILLFTVTFNADEVGTVNFVGESADDPVNEVTLFDFDSAVSAGRIDFGGPLEFDVVNPSMPPFTNVLEPTDVNADGRVTPLDALLVINVLNQAGPQALTDAFAANIVASIFPDVNRDGRLSPIDALLVINKLNSQAAASTSFESTQSVVASAEGVSLSLSMGVLTEEIVSPLDDPADSQDDRMADSTMFFGEFESGLTTTDLGDDTLEDDAQDMVVTDTVLEDTTSYLDEESDSFEDLLATNDLTSGEGDITTSALDPVLSDIAEDIAIAWLE